jgi:hypothetical protein
MESFFSQLNWLAILIAAVSTFLIGGFWYSPFLFGKQWQKENNFSNEDMKKGNTPKIFSLTFLFSLIMALNLAIFLNDSKTTASWGAIAGLLAGFCWAALSFFVIGQFERKSTRYMLIHAGYITFSFIVMGTIIGAWR